MNTRKWLIRTRLRSPLAALMTSSFDCSRKESTMCWRWFCRLRLWLNPYEMMMMQTLSLNLVFDHSTKCCRWHSRWWARLLCLCWTDRVYRSVAASACCILASARFSSAHPQARRPKCSDISGCWDTMKKGKQIWETDENVIQLKEVPHVDR